MVRMKRTWSDSDLINFVKNAQCLADVIDALGLVRGGSYKSIKAHIERLAIDTSHFISNTELAKRARTFIKIRSKEELFIENGEYSDYKRVKEIIIRESLLDYKCALCGIIEWTSKKLNLQLDHINGNKRDNRLENLRFLCPNCHSLTDNFCGKNRKTEKNQKTNTCIDCGKIIGKGSTWCVVCKKKNAPTKIIWPDLQIVVDMTEKYGFVETGRRLGVSDNAVRKHIKNMGSSPNGMAPPS